MSFCPNCGKELVDGEICTCAAQSVENTSAPEPEYTVPQPDAQPEYVAPSEPVMNEAPAPEYTTPQPEYATQQPDYSVPNPEYAAPQYGAPIYYAPVAPAKQQARTDYPEGYKVKKKYVAVLLGYMLGVFGIHNFYLGNKTKGLVQVLLSTVGAIFTLGISTIAVAIWAIVETVLILTEDIDADANGYKIQTLDEALKD